MTRFKQQIYGMVKKLKEKSPSLEVESVVIWKEYVSLLEQEQDFQGFTFHRHSRQISIDIQKRLIPLQVVDEEHKLSLMVKENAKQD